MTKKKLASQVLMNLVSRVILGAIMILLVATAIFSYWYFCTNLDALYLIAIYFTIGSMINLIVVSALQKSYKQYIRKMQRCVAKGFIQA